MQPRAQNASEHAAPPASRRSGLLLLVLAIGSLGVTAGAVGFSLSGIYGAGVASVILLAGLLAASPMLEARLTRA